MATIGYMATTVALLVFAFFCGRAFGKLLRERRQRKIRQHVLELNGARCDAPDCEEPVFAERTCCQYKLCSRHMFDWDWGRLDYYRWISHQPPHAGSWQNRKNWKNW